jgi:riboflavin synthase
VFTGIIEELGTVISVALAGVGALARVKARLVCSDAAAGDSIAVNGVCLTVTEVTSEGFTADVMAETLHRATLGKLRAGAPVNLERAATLATRLGGHLVQGHVDGVAVLRQRKRCHSFDLLRLEFPARLARYVVEKGSITLDGVSLTVIAVTDLPHQAAQSAQSGQDEVGVASLEVGIIPTTLRSTTLGALGEGQQVNVEVDLIAKHVERLLNDRQT